MKLRVIADVHGYSDKYLNMINGCEYSIQLGDLGFDYKFLEENNVDPNKHCWTRGNHDNPHKAESCQNYLGMFGQPLYLPNWDKMFFIGGAWSIDVKYRIPGLTWWPEEEMSNREMDAAFLAYKQVRPELMFSHDCPMSIYYEPGWCNLQFAIDMGWDKAVLHSRTAELLERCFKEHQPKAWYFGHHHKNWEAVRNGTKFRCINQYEYLDIEI